MVLNWQLTVVLCVAIIAPPLPYPIAFMGHAHLVTREDLESKNEEVQP